MQPCDTPPPLVGSSTQLRPDGFDGQQPPRADLISACVHCGFCLTTCPSYRVIGKETDSPRGRIYLMDAINQGEAPLSAASIQHFDSCLGCLACTTACPSGVQYDQLIAAVRPQVQRLDLQELPGVKQRRGRVAVIGIDSQDIHRPLPSNRCL